MRLVCLGSRLSVVGAGWNRDRGGKGGWGGGQRQGAGQITCNRGTAAPARWEHLKGDSRRKGKLAMDKTVDA